jgi:hypothetical protein
VFRRDFLKAFAAAASAAFSGGAAAAAVVPTAAKSAPPAKQATLASRTPQIAVSANTTHFSSEIERVRGLLSECRLVSIEEMSLRDGGCVITASYRHDPDGTPTELDKQWGEYLADAGIRSVEVSSSYEEIDVFHLGSYRSVDTIRPVRDITVEYVKGWQP